jgi:hypothetical protein
MANLFARAEKEQRDWLATHIDDIPSQSRSYLKNMAEWKTGPASLHERFYAAIFSF